MEILWLDLLYVPIGYRRRGIARELIRHVIEKSRKMGLPKVELGTALENRPMLRLAKSTGFRGGQVYLGMDVPKIGGGP